MTGISCLAEEHEAIVCTTEADVEESVYLRVNVEEHSEGMKTSLANSIKHLIGSDDDLVRFDDLRFQLKEAKRAGGNNLHSMANNISEYTELVEKIKDKIRFVKSNRSTKLKQLEKTYYQKHGVLPSKKSKSHYHNILKERNLAVNILRTLK